MSSNKSYAETARDIREELRKWNATEIYLPTAKDAKLEGPAVVVVIEVRGQRLEFPCSQFVRVEDNARAVFKAIEGLRLMDQRGIDLGVLAENAAKLALPDPNDPYDVISRVAGIRVTKASSIFDQRSAYLEAVRRSHPDSNPQVEKGLFKRVQEAGRAIGVGSGPNEA